MSTGRVHDVSAGSGDPMLVFVHGLGCSSEDWRSQIDALSPRHRCVALDLPGHGASPADGALSIARFGATVASLVDAQAAAPCVLVGHSMGCRVALEAAQRLPDAVLGLVFVDGSRQGVGAAEHVRSELRARIGEAGFQPFMTALFSDMFTAASDPALLERVVDRALRLDPRLGSELVADMAAWDAGEMEAALDAVRVPTLAIQSTYMDEHRKRRPLAPGQRTPWTELVSARVAGARIETIAGIGHFTMLEEPRRVSTLIEEFVTAIAAASRP